MAVLILSFALVAAALAAQVSLAVGLTRARRRENGRISRLAASGLAALERTREVALDARGGDL